MGGIMLTHQRHLISIINLKDGTCVKVFCLIIRYLSTLSTSTFFGEVMYTRPHPTGAEYINYWFARLLHICHVGNKNYKNLPEEHGLFDGIKEISKIIPAPTIHNCGEFCSCQTTLCSLSECL